MRRENEEGEDRRDLTAFPRDLVDRPTDQMHGRAMKPAFMREDKRSPVVSPRYLTKG